ncbi:MAG: HlyD family efflux transporter periplasmic adaptor subunit [Lentisphaeria bacterium]|nr:HlyD family efflux transporter periplasmic adaptor subunit [Lentisphaeria bacterium]
MIFQVEHFNFQRLLKTFRRIGLGILLLFVILFLIVIFGEMNDEVAGLGTVTGIREYTLKSLVDAPSVKIFHMDGEELPAGTPLMELDSRTQREKITLLRHQLQELETLVSSKEKALALLRRDPLPDYYRNTELELSAARERLRLAEKEFEVYSDLYKKKAVTRKEFLQVELNLLSNRITARRLERDTKRLEDGMAQQIIERAEDELKQFKHRCSAKRDELAMEIRHLDDYIIRAPDSGILTDIPPRPGNYYTKGDAVARFAANKNKKVIGMIHESQIYKVSRGQSARIEAKQYNYLDYGYFYGQVETIYQLPETVNGERYYPVKILLMDEKLPLRFGSSCKVTIITGRERILALLLGIRSKDYLVRRGLVRGRR